jgi:CspA family cold shock protein
MSGSEPQAHCNGLTFLVLNVASTFGRIIGPFRLAARRALAQKSPNIDSPGAEPRVARPRVQMQHASERIISMTNGTVKFYNSQKGFGFIQPDDGGKDVFVHVTALERAGIRGLNEGQKVAFDTQPDRKTGKVAVNNIQAL